MIAFIDSSVLLRMLFGEPNALAQWVDIDEAYASRLLSLEVARVIDRCRLDGTIEDDDVANLHEESRRVLRSVEVLAMTEAIVARAAQPMPTVLGTLDAIHLATALELAPTVDGSLAFATHDRQQARAARALGLPVLGV